MRPLVLKWMLSSCILPRENTAKAVPTRINGPFVRKPRSLSSEMGLCIS